MSNSLFNEETLEWVVAPEQSGERIDKYITESIDSEGISRTQVQEWIKSGAAVVDGQTVKANFKVSEGNVVQLTIPEPEDAAILPENIPLDVMYEDSDVIVVNKPRGMVVHPAVGHSSGTLVNALMFHCKDLSGINGVVRPGIVHRIDKDTTGLLMAAKNDLAHVSLAQQLKEHTVTRKYMALVHGNLQHDQGTIDAPIGRDSRDRKLFTVTDHNSRHAVTHFVVLERIGTDYTLVELQLETGRTHQIRVHMKYIGHPLAGDPVYGRNKTVALNGQALHAAELGFAHPRTGKRLEFTVPIPADMEHVLNSLRLR
ncbi:RluA family pseudouridine synthase [Paenibacillus harenae]|uniref:RluA family pseudouridine synthase n=1 Tax=Paenibacillus harenae TaxID=306543 RepID=UPI002791B00A|nr:RluA family pseudouridine synthase [Paenibacillus harenae]MDQ0059425.1 23S rRNA pseudouridine1911/1915/1917 synthase [Paenibacillus harenae]